MIRTREFGVLDGVSVPLITLRAEADSAGGAPIEVDITPYGAAIVAIRVPDRDGEIVDVCLGYDTLAEYAEQGGALGGSIGRFANRIARGTFSIDGREYHVTPNEGPNTLHGGRVGFHQRLWDWEEAGPAAITCCLHSPDGDEGFPGDFDESVTYAVTPTALSISYRARSSRDTPVSLTNHAYFNLSGHDSGRVLEHMLMLTAPAYTPVGPGLIPTGEIRSVSGSVMDLRTPTRLGDRIGVGELKDGYDHNFVLPDGAGESRIISVLYSPTTGIEMTTSTTMEAVQLYTAGSLTERPGKGGARYGKWHAVCLETQRFPDAVNHAEFPDALLRAGEEYSEETTYSFGVR